MTPAGAQPGAAAAKPVGRLDWRWLLAAAVVIVCFVWIVPSFAPYEETAAAIRVGLSRSSTTLLVAAALVAGVNLVAPSLNQVAALPGLRLHHAVALDWASTTITNVVPGGSAGAIALTWSTYRRLGFTGDDIGRSVVVTGVGDQLVKLGTPLVAVVWLLSQDRGFSGTGQVSEPLIIRSAGLAAALFVVALGLAALILSSRGTGIHLDSLVARMAERVVNPLLARSGRTPVDWLQRLGQLRDDTRHLLAKRGGLLVSTTLLGHASLFLMLVLCLQIVGEDASVGIPATMVAFTFARLATAIPLTPGALGVAEVSLIGALSAVTEAETATLVAAVALFRAASYLMPTFLGLPGLALTWRLGRTI